MENVAIHEKLVEEGWKLTPAALQQVTENQKISDVKAVIRRLLDIDLKAVSAGTLPEDINKTKYENLPGGIVLQLQKVKNLSSPKYQESLHNNPNPNIIKVVLTDGVLNVQGVVMEPINHLNMNTPPGSKILLTSAVDIAHCFLMLSKENTSFIGGRVELLVEKWELNRKLAKHKRDVHEEGGPPPWIPFGQKISKPVVADRNFKSLEMGKTKEENTEFEAQRKDAIMEASKIGAPKVFGGGNNKLLDHNVQIIVDAGFTVEQAEYALKVCKNNKDRALRSLMAKNAKPVKDEDKKEEKKPEKSERGPKGGKGRGKNKDEEGGSLKPSGKVSLFDFLEDKLPASEREAQLEARNFMEGRGRGKTVPDKNDPQQQLLKSLGDDRRGREERGGRGERRSDYHSNRQDDRRQERDRKPDVVKFDGARRNGYYDQRNDKSFGNFKDRNDFASKTETVKIGPRWNDKRDPKPGQSKSYSSKPERPFEDDYIKKPFAPTGDRPPRFQKNQPDGPPWNDPKSAQLQYPKLPQNSDYSTSRQQNNDPPRSNTSIPPFKLENSLANLSLQQNIANFNHAQETRTAMSANMKNVFFPSMAGNSGGGEGRGVPPSAPPPFQRRSPAILPQELKTQSFPGMPAVPDYPFKANGTMMQGYNDFQAVFGGAAGRPSSSAFTSQQPMPFGNQHPNFTSPATHFTAAPVPQPAPFNSGNFNAQPAPPSASNSFPSYTTTPFMTAQQVIQAAPQPTAQPNTTAPQARRWAWKKGHKCFARYWEDQNYYEALVTGVSENTCVVHFLEYGNYEEVLHDDCVPLDGISPDT